MELMAYSAKPKKWHYPQVVGPQKMYHQGPRPQMVRPAKEDVPGRPGTPQGAPRTPPRGRSAAPGVDLRLQNNSEGPGILQPITTCMENTNTLSPLNRPLSTRHAQVYGKYIHLDHPRQPQDAQDHKTLIFLRFFQGVEAPSIGFP